MGRKLLDLEVRRRDRVIGSLTAEADPADATELRHLLVEAIRRDGWDEARVNEFEMDIRLAGERRVLTTFVTSR